MIAADTDDGRRRRDGLGHRAEARCVWMLRLRGYRIVGRRLRTPGGEIDILARRGQTLAAIEVKARQNIATAAEAITPRQKRRIERAALWYLSTHPELSRLDLRFDAMFVVPNRLPVHLKNAWQATGGGTA